MKYNRKEGYLMLTDLAETYAILIPEKPKGNLEATVFDPRKTPKNKEIVNSLRHLVTREEFAKALKIVMPERSDRDIELCLKMLESGKLSIRQAIWVA